MTTPVESVPIEYELGYFPVESMRQAEWNTQEMEQVTFSRLVEEIKRSGFNSPLTIVGPMDDDMYRIIGGNHRWQAAQIAGLTRVPALVVPLDEWDEDEQKFITTRLNVLSGHVNPAKFLKLYEEMATKYAAEVLQDLFAYTDKRAFERMVEGTKEGVSKSLPKELSKEFNEAAKEAKTTDDIERILRDIFNKYGESVQQNFMVFTAGKREHIYVSMNSAMEANMGVVMDYCTVTGENINMVMLPVVEDWAKLARVKLEHAAETEEDPIEEELF